MIQHTRLSSRARRHSIRRGSLQALAAAGTALPELMRFAGHRRELTTLRYLGWGTAYRAGNAAQANAAAVGLELAWHDSSQQRSGSSSSSRSSSDSSGDDDSPGAGAVALA